MIPDAWFELAVAGHQPVAIAVELDRGSEDQRRWRGKVAALAAWAAGPYRQAFGADTLTIAVVTPNETRREALRAWTAQELARTGHQQLAEIFLVTSADPVTTPPEQLFFNPCWYEPTTPTPVSLLLPPLAAAPVLGKDVWPVERDDSGLPPSA